MNVMLAFLLGTVPHRTNQFFDSISQALTNAPKGHETLIFLAGVLALVLLLAIAARAYGRKDTPGAGTDYLTIAVDLLGLNEHDRRDLKKIAKQARLKEPVAMLLSPMNLARAAGSVSELERDAEFRRRVEQLCLRLFEAPLPDPGRLPPNNQHCKP